MPVSSEKTAKELYQDAVQLDQSGDQSPDVAKRARELFKQAAEMGHTAALVDYANYLYSGRGGEADKPHALLLIWRAFREGHHEALDDLANLLEEFSQEYPDDSEKAAAAKAAKDIESLKVSLQPVVAYMQNLSCGLLRERRPRT